MEFFKGRHTGAAIATTVRNVVDKWNLQGKVAKILTDNAKNMIAAFEKAVLTAEASETSDAPSDTSDAESEASGEDSDSDSSDVSAAVYDADGNINYDVLEGDDLEEIPPATMKAALHSIAEYLDDAQRGSLLHDLRARVLSHASQENLSR
eukprot:GHVU01009492.1.p1 GENE.GHVU01009492.1~~GHVU01009492.1.p1  ORF type:complete len:151 (+),score=30.39 GHVU01009492.1:494-946(+)